MTESDGKNTGGKIMQRHLRNVSRTRPATAQHQEINIIIGLINDLVAMFGNVLDFKESYLGDDPAPSE